MEIISKSYLSTFGMTRAIDILYLSAPRNFRYGEESDYMECRFLSEIKKEEPDDSSN